jgi:hypothetical protein
LQFFEAALKWQCDLLTRIFENNQACVPHTIAELMLQVVEIPRTTQEQCIRGLVFGMIAHPCGWHVFAA